MPDVKGTWYLVGGTKCTSAFGGGVVRERTLKMSPRQPRQLLIVTSSQKPLLYVQLYFYLYVLYFFQRQQVVAKGYLVLVVEVVSLWPPILSSNPRARQSKTRNKVYLYELPT